ncbi:MAG: hypothetical protein QM724_00445 [Flavobacteriales bacterium]
MLAVHPPASRQPLSGAGMRPSGGRQPVLGGAGKAGRKFPDPGQRRCWHYAVILLLLAPIAAQAQTDTTSIYRKIEAAASKHKFTQWIYDGIFVPPKDADEPAPSSESTRRVNPFLKYAGRIVRNIEVRTFDPFGFSVDDTTLKPVNVLQTWADRLHRKTRPRIVRNLLLVKPLEPLDSLQVTESERVLRASPYVNDARIMPLVVGKDSVDLLVLVHDKWSIDVDGEADLTSASGRLRERNFLGWGQALEQRVGYRLGVPQLALSGSHSVYNIGRSYVSSNVFYSSNEDADQVGFALSRPFYSPLAKWAGGVSWDRTWGHYDVTDADGVVQQRYRLDPTNADAWVGRGFVLGDGKSMGSRSSNIIVAARYAQTRYFDRPPPSVDPTGVYRNNSLFLVSTGLSIRQYYKERYLFRFGNSEDVPEGLLVRATVGVQRRELTPNAPYVGVDASRGRNYTGIGYLSAGIGYGTFFQGRDVSDGTFRLSLLYFSDLRTWGRWHFRQFGRFNLTYGYNKPAYSYITLNGTQLYGFSSNILRGVHKEVLDLETVAYAPYNLWGFRIAPVLLMGFGTIGDEHDPVFAGRIYSAFSLGLLVRNENLLVRTFEVSVGFFPYVPDKGGSLLEFNNFGSFSSRAADFTFAEPGVIAFE